MFRLLYPDAPLTDDELHRDVLEPLQRLSETVDAIRETVVSTLIRDAALVDTLEVLCPIAQGYSLSSESSVPKLLGT